VRWPWVRELLKNCGIGIHSALNVVGLEYDEHRGVGLHSARQMAGVQKTLETAQKNGCAAVAKKLKEIAKNKGQL